MRRTVAAALLVLAAGCASPDAADLPACTPLPQVALSDLSRSAPDATLTVGAWVPAPGSLGGWPAVLVAARDDRTGQVLLWATAELRANGELDGPVVALTGPARELSDYGADLSDDSPLRQAADELADSPAAAAAEQCAGQV